MAADADFFFFLVWVQKLRLIIKNWAMLSESGCLQLYCAIKTELRTC